MKAENKLITKKSNIKMKKFHLVSKYANYSTVDEKQSGPYHSKEKNEKI